jgi:threonylcarbamoyladenosine tRNA methylthiotransferase MtaB
VQDGCSGKCTFCIVPKFRGQPASTPFAEVLGKARRFVDAGYSELVVTGCNLSLYDSEGKRLPELAAALADVAPRVRLGSVEPSDAAREILDVMAERANVCRFLHVPVQSGSSRILSAMGRPYSARDIDEFVHFAREKVPGIALGCDLMTGFPGEGDIDFLATKGLLTRARFERVHVFPFSERPGTPAAAMPGAVPDEIRRARARELASQADRIRSAAAREFVGKTVEFVVEDEKTCSGWTSEYFWCSCPHSHAPRRSLAKAKIRTSEGHALSGEIDRHGG